MFTQKQNTREKNKLFKCLVKLFGKPNVYETDSQRKQGLRVKGRQRSLTGRGWLGTGLLQHFVLWHFPQYICDTPFFC